MGTKALSFAVIALLAYLLVLPGGLAAKDKRGATVVVTRTDGRLVEGELIAVKPDGLVVLNPTNADAISIAAADLAGVRIVRPSKIGTGALWGGLGGALVGSLLGGLSGGVDEFTAGQAAFMIGFVFGGIGCLGGLGVGSLLSVDTTVEFSGEPDSLVMDRLDKLRSYSREYRMGGGRLQMKIAPPPEPSPRPPVPAPEAARPAPSPSRRTPRFRVRLPYTVPIRPGFEYGDHRSAETTFRFLDDAPEPGPFPAKLFSYAGNHNVSGFDSTSVGYEFSERLAAEAEVVFGRWSASRTTFGDLSYTSALDGITYETHALYIGYSARFTAALFGLTYRPAAPTEFRRHIVEAGLAAGPAWAKLETGETFGQGNAGKGKVTLAARGHVAYDFHVTPTLSFGAAVGYRWFRAGLAASTSTMVLDFHDTSEEYPTTTIQRTTEWTVPAQTIDASGFYIGLRMGVRF